MKKLFRAAFALALLAATAAVWAEPPKIAVLDTTIPKGFDSSVIIPVTENIIEEMVKSKKYTVLDRNNIAAIFKERDFQLTGEVPDSEITRAGKMLGATFVVVSKMQQVGDTYFLTAKMIDVTTAAITGQASYTKEGKLTVLLEMAHVVGWSLATGERIPSGDTASPITRASPAPSPAAAAKASPAAAAPAGKAAASITGKGTLYTQVGLHPDARGRGLSAASYVQEGYIPAGTAVEYVDMNRSAYKFRVVATGEVHTYEFHKQAAEDFRAHLERVFGTSWDPMRVSLLSKVDQEGIAQGKALVGMSREGVVLAVGLPPKLENPKYEADQWTYWTSRFNTVSYQFDAKGTLVRIKN